ncbi:aldehyde dehydrogenase family protein [Streptomyces sp. CC0208]|uniref:aldehyde dehydrogenase family protein n=2 Tax=Streptomyces TaxID=1883 RepID=UPI000E5114DA|nr:aldehyde dehydrogenase family protein [Streptomyces sp. CC0208]
MFLDGRLHGTGHELTVTDPWLGSIVGTLPADGPEQVEAALTVLAAAGPTPPATDRREVLARAADLITQRAEEFAALITAEAGICRAESAREVERAVGNLRVAAVEAERIRGESIPVPGADRLAVTVPEPIGVVAAITPFNRPLNQVVVKVAPAVAAGCPVAVKPSERTPLTAIRFAEVLIEAGLPPDRLAVLVGQPREVGPALVGHPEVAMVTLTGSVATGRTVAAMAAGRKLLLELGGNDPLFVLPDTDLTAAARLAADGACATAGQSCRGVKRVIVWESVADAFVPLLTAAVAAKRAGDPHAADTDVGPLITEDAARLVAERVAAAEKDGAVVTTGGTHTGPLMAPTVLDRVRPHSDLVTEETFGPVAPVLRVADTDEAVRLSNSTPYGLQAGVLTNDSAAFWELASRLRVGAVNLGAGPHYDSPHIPFGGVKASGVGREGIRYAIAEMTSIKTVTLPYR